MGETKNTINFESLKSNSLTSRPECKSRVVFLKGPVQKTGLFFLLFLVGCSDPQVTNPTVFCEKDAGRGYHYCSVIVTEKSKDSVIYTWEATKLTPVRKIELINE